MIFFDEIRPSEEPYVEYIWRAHSEGAYPFRSIAVCTCELVISKFQGKTTMTVRGPETKNTDMGDCPGDYEWLGITLKLGTFLPHLPASMLVDDGVDLPEATNNTFWLAGSSWQFPDINNAETFIDRLARQELLLREPIVDAAMLGQIKDISLSTVQRRFLQATGITHSAVRQIERARHATWLLQHGASILDTIDETGYYDQPHLSRSLKHYIGQTPAQIREQSQAEQMPFLYKTTSFR